MTLFARRILPILLWLLSSGGHAVAQKTATKAPPGAEFPTIYFWGIQRGCFRDEYLTDRVRRRLEKLGGPVVLVDTDVVTQNASCVGEVCWRAFQAACPGSAGILVGGVVTQRPVAGSGGEPRIWQLLRLWRVEAGSSGRAAYLHHACRACDVPEMLSRLSAELAETSSAQQMTAQQVLATKPVFCSHDNLTASPASTDRRIALMFRGVAEAGISRARILRALKYHLIQTGREVVQAADEGSDTELGGLALWVGNKRGHEALGVELLAEGQVRLRHLDAVTRTTTEATADCLGCNEATLVRRLVQAAGPLLDRCLGEQCRADAVSTALRLPADLCQPSSEYLFADCVLQ